MTRPLALLALLMGCGPAGTADDSGTSSTPSGTSTPTGTATGTTSTTPTARSGSPQARARRLEEELGQGDGR